MLVTGDCTYNTNCYGLYFLQFVGFTSTGHNFTIAYAFLKYQSADDYKWALENLHSLFTPPQLPKVFVTDRELGFISAIRTVFPDTAHFLCRRHIEVNVRKHGLSHTGSEDFAESFMRSFNYAISAPTSGEWHERWQHLCDRFRTYPVLLDYLRETWINPYSQNILSMHTDVLPHFGTHTTNRTEGEHNRLKKALGSASSTFDTIFKKAHKIFDIQLKNIKQGMNRSKTRFPIDLRTCNLYHNILTKVSTEALRIIRQERGRIQKIKRGLNGGDVITEAACGCYYRRTHELPCSHEIARIEDCGGRIELASIHDFWKKLDIEVDNPPSEPSINKDNFQALLNKFEKAPEPVRRKLFKTVEEGLNHHTRDAYEPDHISKANKPRTGSSREPSDWEHTNNFFGVPATPSSTSKGYKSSLIFGSHFTFLMYLICMLIV